MIGVAPPPMSPEAPAQPPTADARPARAWSRPNVFQRVMRHWDRLHPYNGIQEMAVRGATADDAERAWRATRRDLGLGRVEWDHRLLTSTYRYAADPRAADADPFDRPAVADAASADALLTDLLNRPAGDGEALPFRAFAYPDPADPAACRCGLLYRHWAADSVAVQWLMRQWLLRITGDDGGSATTFADPGGGYLARFGPRRAGWSGVGTVAGSLAWVRRMKRVRRLESPESLDLRTRFTRHRLDAPGGSPLLPPLLASARRDGATLGDVFLAAAAGACREVVPTVETAKRTDLAMGTIVDLRRRHGVAPDALGLYLGHTHTLYAPGDFDDFPSLLAATRRQSARARDRREAEAGMAHLAAADWLGRVLPEHRERGLYRKRVALAGGISNVDLNRTWVAGRHPDPVVDYCRVSPAGPMMPVVFATTGLGDRLTLGLTCRASVLDAPASVLDAPASVLDAPASVLDAAASAGLVEAFRARLVEYANGP